MTKPKRPSSTEKRKPVDLAEIESFFDLISRLMQKAEDPRILLPIWRALERERGLLEDEQRILREARLRARRL